MLGQVFFDLVGQVAEAGPLVEQLGAEDKIFRPPVAVAAKTIRKHKITPGLLFAPGVKLCAGKDYCMTCSKNFA